MPIKTSAKKAMRVSARRHEENILRKVTYKRALKDAKRVGEAELPEALVNAQSALDKAVKTKLLHKNTASRLLSRLVKSTKSDAVAKAPAKKKIATKKAVTKAKAKKK